MMPSRRGFLIGGSALAFRSAGAVKGVYVFEQACIAPPSL
jgi:hypothetical protein